MLIAEVDIPKGRELFFDYNDRRRCVVIGCPWMANDNYIPPATADITLAGKIYIPIYYCVILLLLFVTYYIVL